MEIDPGKKTASLAVAELSAFSAVRAPGGPGHFGRWRARAGRMWHAALQEEFAEAFDREEPVGGVLERGGWTIRLEGRCDLLRRDEDGDPVFGEIKTVTDPLPLPVAELRARYPSYFRQPALYSLLAGTGQTAPEPPPFLVFVEIDSGIRQTVPLESADFEETERHLGRFVRFLEGVAGRHSAKTGLRWESFRRNPREGQTEAAELLQRAAASSRVVGFEAPTGFGKTRIVLEHALEALRDERADRILYLTGKTSGQEQAGIEFDALFPGPKPLRAYRMRNHREHWAVCPVDGCEPDQCAPADPGPGEPPPVAEGDQSGRPADAWETVKRAADAASFCPYALSRAQLAFSDLWIADYNYLFSPASRHLFLEQPDFDPRRCWLLVDEAHNLPDRVSSALGGGTDRGSAERAAAELRDAGASPFLRDALREFADGIGRLTPGRAASREATYGLLDQLEAVRDAFDRKPVPWRRVSADTARLLLSLEAADFLFERDELSPVFWCPSAERLEWLPLETGPWIAGCLDGFAGTTLFSATLRPFESLVRAIGFPAGQPEFVGVAPVPSDRFRIAIDARAETTLRRRKGGYAATAARVRSFAEAADGCVAVFFPSYEYAEAIRTYLEAEAPHLRVTLQPRDLDAEERDHFARFAPLGNDILLLMLGGSFAEAIDAFGGVIRRAVIVGPALPELSALTRLRMDAYPDRETGFHEVCRVPGMRRVNQAIGRFVRQADHRADILLYDKRFLEPEYRSLLRADLPDPTIIRTPSDWQTWLHPPS